MFEGTEGVKDYAKVLSFVTMEEDTNSFFYIIDNVSGKAVELSRSNNYYIYQITQLFCAYVNVLVLMKFIATNYWNLSAKHFENQTQFYFY